MRAHDHPATRGQSGASLLVVLMLLTVVSLLGMAAFQLSVMGERGARNDRDYQIAWQAAEAALADAEFDIEGENESESNTSSRSTVFDGESTSSFLSGCGTYSDGTSWGLCLTTTSSSPLWQIADIAGDDTDDPVSVPFGTFTDRDFDAGTGLQPAKVPRYIIEAVSDYGASSGTSTTAIAYRITAIGFGPRSSTRVVLQSIYRK